MMIDRIAPTRRPQGRVAQRQAWHSLSFLHWRVPASALRALVPRELSIDTFDGDAFVGIVPFTMTGVRPLWAPPVPGISNFHETNVRTYVHHEGRNPGVWFFSLDAASRVAVSIARTFWHLPYHFAEMSLDAAELESGGERALEIRYASTRIRPEPLPAELSLTVRTTSDAESARPGTLEHFLAERYVLYADVGQGELRRGRVHHAPYPLQRAEAREWKESLLGAARIAREERDPLVHFASGVKVEIFGLTGLDADDSG
jgi:uncharacterized protein YqjF (DUF2071 family)